MRSRRDLSAGELAAGVRDGDRALLARAITLIESDAPAHQARARALLRLLHPRAGGALRLGVTGVPGAGKSTFIERFGLHVCSQGHRLAVLAVDPSSTISRGSILGDKTRMEDLARHPACFIRPSPSSGTLGGVARKTRETILVCEAAGFDVVIVETVGVGQSEVTVRSLVDFFLLLVLTGAGDELQGIKRGVMELADGIVVNKADGENKPRADRTRGEYETVLRYRQAATEGWRTPVRLCSALSGEGVAEIWSVLQDFRRATTASGVWAERRRRQTIESLQAQLEEGVRARLCDDPALVARRRALEADVLAGRLDASSAAEALLRDLWARP